MGQTPAVAANHEIWQYYQSTGKAHAHVLQNKLDVPQLLLFEVPVLPRWLLVCPESQNSISDWGMSSLFCNTTDTQSAAEAWQAEEGTLQPGHLSSCNIPHLGRPDGIVLFVQKAACLNLCLALGPQAPTAVRQSPAVAEKAWQAEEGVHQGAHMSTCKSYVQPGAVRKGLPTSGLPN